MGDGTTTTAGSVGVESTGGTTKENTTNTTTTTNVENNKETTKETKETKENNVSVNSNNNVEHNKETKEDSNSNVNVEHEKRYNELNVKYETTMKELQSLKIENSVIRLGHESGLDNKTIALFKGTIKNETIIDSKGNIKEDAIKSEIEKFLNDFPMLRAPKKSNYVKIGADTQKEDSAKSFQDELDKAFRIK